MTVIDFDIYCTEPQLRKLVGENISRQGWHARREKLREFAGSRMGGVWFYNKLLVEEFLEDTDRYRPHTMPNKKGE